MIRHAEDLSVYDWLLYVSILVQLDERTPVGSYELILAMDMSLNKYSDSADSVTTHYKLNLIIDVVEK